MRLNYSFMLRIQLNESLKAIFSQVLLHALPGAQGYIRATYARAIPGPILGSSMVGPCHGGSLRQAFAALDFRIRSVLGNGETACSAIDRGGFSTLLSE